MPECKCPTCYSVLDSTTSADGRSGPTPNDLSICIYCAEKLIFANDLTVRKITDAELRAIPHSELIYYLTLVQNVKAHILMNRHDNIN